jgi:CRP/FNR family transcriptional regulator, cyclic AMP receptor protein
VEWTLLEALPPEQARAVIQAARRRKFGRGEVVFHEGDPGDSLHLVESGHAAVRVTTPLGEIATLRVVGPGEFFGELSVVSPGPRAATVSALEPLQTLTLHRDQIDSLRSSIPSIERALLEAVVAEVRRTTAQLLDAMYVPATTRLARRIVDLARTYPAGPDGRITIPLTQDDLAGLCGTTRPTVNQLLSKLVDRKLVELGRGRFVVTDLPGLIRRAS